MKMKPVDPAAVIRDPHTKRPLAAEGGDVPDTNFWTRRWLAGEVWRLDGNAWVRRTANGDVVRELAAQSTARVEEMPAFVEPTTLSKARS